MKRILKLWHTARSYGVSRLGAFRIILFSFFTES
jgi:hypothetical protein